MIQIQGVFYWSPKVLSVCYHPNKYLVSFAMSYSTPLDMHCSVANP